jgi:thiol-disulfide isomerase/thioredoxin
MMLACRAAVVFLLSTGMPFSAFPLFAQDTARPVVPAETSGSKSAPSKKGAPPNKPSPAEELQKAIDSAGNDRAALVHNLEQYLKQYPEAPQRPQIYRALVEACLQLREVSRATDYAERIVALTPEDMSITLLAIQLLEKSGDEAALRRAVTYSSRLMNYVKNSSLNDKSPRVSPEEWENEKKRDQMTLLLLRGRLEAKLQDTSAARMDYEASYALLPNATAAVKLGELDELHKDYAAAITEYAHAFALADSSPPGAGRREIRMKLGNAWRLAHGSEAGLGDFILRTFDEVSSVSDAKPAKNAGIKDPFEFTLRKAPDGAALPLVPWKRKVLVVNFWATWCGPCRALEPLYEHVAAQFRSEKDVLFLSADCDDDESLVAPYLNEVKPKTNVVFADGLDSLFGVEAFPTVLVLDRSGKIAFRSDGFGDDRFEQDLTAAVRMALAAPAPPTAPLHSNP